MKNYSITIVFGFFCLLKATAQNPGFYQVHPDNSAINWYFQLNRDPIIIQNGELTSEQNLPEWYHALQFLLCPGVFETVEEAYGYFTSNPMFIDAAGNSYEDRNRPDQQLKYVSNFKEILSESKSYSTNEEARGDTNVYVLAGCYEVVVFGEVYLQYHNYEILFLYLSNMFLTGMDVNSAADIQRTINILTKNGYDYMPDDYDMSLSYLLKEDGVWKCVDYEKMDTFLKTNIPTLEFMQENGRSVVHIESTLDASGNRVYYIDGESACRHDTDRDGIGDCEDLDNRVNNGSIVSTFSNDQGNWADNGDVVTSLENGGLKVSEVDGSWEGVKLELSELMIAPDVNLNISLNFDKGTTNAAVRLYVQELDENGKHLSWNVINGNLQTGAYEYQYTVRNGQNAVLRIDKSDTYLEETTHFFINSIQVNTLDCVNDSDHDGTVDCSDLCLYEPGEGLDGCAFETAPPFSISNPTYKPWHGGQPGVSGIIVRFEIDTHGAEIQLDRLFFKGKEEDGFVQDAVNPNVFRVHYNTSSRQGSIFQPFFVPEIPEDPEFPFDLQDTEAALEYTYQGEKQYFKITELQVEQSDNLFPVVQSF